MSSILEALRKVDEQKSARRQQPVDLSKGVLKAQAAPQRLRIKPWQLAAACAAVAVVSILITLLAVRPEKRQVPVPAAVQSFPAKTASGSAVPQQSPVTVPEAPIVKGDKHQLEKVLEVNYSPKARVVKSPVPTKQKSTPVMATTLRQPVTEPVVTPVVEPVPVRLPPPPSS